MNAESVGVLELRRHRSNVRGVGGVDGQEVVKNGFRVVCRTW